jgi:hypothetical protein
VYGFAISTEKTEYPMVEISIHDVSGGRAPLVLDSSGQAEGFVASRSR